jgi:putative membrane protein
MIRKLAIIAAAALVASAPAFADTGPSDAEIAHIAYTAGALDVAAAKQAIAKAQSEEVRAFAQTMIRDHEAVNGKALALVKKLGVAPAPNAVSASLSGEAEATLQRLASLPAGEFDRAYAQSEADFHRTVNGALQSTLIPAADNAELRALLDSGLALFREHQTHAEQLAAKLK